MYIIYILPSKYYFFSLFWPQCAAAWCGISVPNQGTRTQIAAVKVPSPNPPTKYFLICIPHFFFFCLFRATPMTDGVPRLGVGAVAADLCHTHSDWGSFKPLSKARDRTCALMDTSWVHYCLCHNGNSPPHILIHFIYIFVQFRIFSSFPWDCLFDPWII